MTTLDDDIFLVTVGARTGSNWIRSAIYTDPGVQFHRERWNYYMPERFNIAASYDGFLDQAESVRSADRRNLFKVATDQCPFIPELLSDRPGQIIFQYRENLLAQHSSEQIGFQHDNWFSRSPVRHERIPFHHHMFMAFVINRSVVTNLILRHHPDIFVTRYETSFQDVPRIAERFGLTLDISQMQPVAKINATNVLDRFIPADHNTVIAALRDIQKTEWLTDHTDIPNT